MVNYPSLNLTSLKNANSENCKRIARVTDVDQNDDKKRIKAPSKRLEKKFNGTKIKRRVKKTTKQDSSESDTDSDSDNVFFVSLDTVQSKDAVTSQIQVPEDKKLRPLAMLHEGGYPNRIFVAGGTLSGKSYWVRMVVFDYLDRFPENKFVLFSTLDKDDDLYKDIDEERFFKIRLDRENLLNNPIEMSELKDSIVVCDDVHLSDKLLDKAYTKLKDEIIKAGRHKNIYSIVTSQALLDGHKTKVLLENSFQVVGFPESAGRYQLGNYLRDKMKLDKAMINRVLNVDSRWVLLSRTKPMYCLNERGCFFLVDKKG